MTGFTWSRPVVPTNRIETTVRRNGCFSSTESRLVLESKGHDWPNDLLRNLMNSAWKTQADTEDALYTELRWNGQDGPLKIRSHFHITIGSLKCCLRSESQRTIAQSSGYADETEETGSPCLPNISDSSPTGSTHVVEPERTYCTSTSRTQNEI
ncbi:ORF2 [Coconut foliar decay alphasatellite]|uniref:Uncharacterized protein n=2 Tax=Coconut foliar decay alphasatellite 1 TaxID=2161874 RepID=A0A2R4N981_9VIRU|nr:ORF2 [Coconut foliar decay alphasatellite]AAA42895.1 ORF2 [Coconut foliar decay virus]AVX29415.1 hypothetical protein [Coconut foliar decay alphasatellite 1]AVX29417.1 hypothetical protein [Coconut foliar decay alphasatellite 1]AVX29419.1 hypothetical protein [Coconut foliar decay alphasatellite 1]